MVRIENKGITKVTCFQLDDNLRFNWREGQRVDKRDMGGSFILPVDLSN